jgi:hypothetical protein
VRREEEEGAVNYVQIFEIWPAYLQEIDWMIIHFFVLAPNSVSLFLTLSTLILLADLRFWVSWELDLRTVLSVRTAAISA